MWKFTKHINKKWLNRSEMEPSSHTEWKTTVKTNSRSSWPSLRWSVRNQLQPILKGQNVYTASEAWEDQTNAQNQNSKWKWLRSMKLILFQPELLSWFFNKNFLGSHLSSLNYTLHHPNSRRFNMLSSITLQKVSFLGEIYTGIA